MSVSYRYVLIAPLNPPKSDSAQTDSVGAADLRFAVPGGGYLEVTAPGYLGIAPCWPPQEYFIQKKPVPKVAEIRLYREPAPAITIVVTNGYRGPLAMEFHHVGAWVQEQAGKRDFTFRASQTGHLRVNASPLLFEVDPSEFEFKYENGQPIPKGLFVGPGDVCVWGLDGVAGLDDRSLFCVGTQHDAEALGSVLNGTGDGNRKAFGAFFAETPTSQSSRVHPK